ncbi:sigma factor [Prosthecobacter sp.]|uniref:sigma factor n=1 Tax=Prosthecobacter sp. TaxID=1965333 RepID=UPI0037833F40
MRGFNTADKAGLKVYLEQIDMAKPLMPAQEGEPGEREVRAGMIRANLRLVVELALEQRDSCEVPILDLISGGNIGLMKAVERFDPGKEGEFSVFVRWWIRQGMKREVAKHAEKVPASIAQPLANQGTDEDIALPA